MYLTYENFNLCFFYHQTVSLTNPSNDFDFSRNIGNFQRKKNCPRFETNAWKKFPCWDEARKISQRSGIKHGKLVPAVA